MTQTTPADDTVADAVGAWRYLAENLDDFYLDGSNTGADTTGNTPDDNTDIADVRDQHETGYKTVEALLTDLTGDDAANVKIDDGDDDEAGRCANNCRT